METQEREIQLEEEGKGKFSISPVQKR